MYPPINAICVANAGVQAVLGTSPTRFYPFGESVQSGAKPYAAWQVIGGSPENFINQAPDMDLFSLQVDAYATTATAARAVAQALRDAIEPYAHIVAWRGESREPDTKLYRYSFDVDWWVPRETAST